MKLSIREILTITFGTLIVSAAVYFFMLPSHVSIGSGAALAMIMSNFIPCRCRSSPWRSMCFC